MSKTEFSRELAVLTDEQLREWRAKDPMLLALISTDIIRELIDELLDRRASREFLKEGGAARIRNAALDEATKAAAPRYSDHQWNNAAVQIKNAILALKTPESKK